MRDGECAAHGGDAQETATILRFVKAERMIHWAIAVPFTVCFASALVLVLVYNPAPMRPYRAAVSWVHRISGMCLTILPLLAVVRGRSEFRVHVANVKEAWTWIADDVKWLFVMGPAAISSRFTLPEQGKFNAAEKLNFMMVMTTWPMFVLSGVMIWTHGMLLYSWLLHFALAAVAAPLVLGHVFMATINPSTRVGLSGMVTGYVDRQWAKHHYTRWYRRHFAEPAAAPAAVAPAAPAVAAAPARFATIVCSGCGCEHPVGAWAVLLDGSEAWICPTCGSMPAAVPLVAAPGQLERLIEELDQLTVDGALRQLGADDDAGREFTAAVEERLL